MDGRVTAGVDTDSEHAGTCNDTYNTDTGQDTGNYTALTRTKHQAAISGRQDAFIFEATEDPPDEAGVAGCGR